MAAQPSASAALTAALCSRANVAPRTQPSGRVGFVNREPGQPARLMLRTVVASTAAEALIKRCAQCGRKLGMIVHRTFTLRFCTSSCKKAYEQQRRDEVRKKMAQIAFLARATT